jgi:hypothetical protein
LSIVKYTKSYLYICNKCIYGTLLLYGRPRITASPIRGPVTFIPKSGGDHLILCDCALKFLIGIRLKLVVISYMPILGEKEF